MSLSAIRRGLHAAASEAGSTRASFVTVTKCTDSVLPNYGELRYFVTYAQAGDMIYLPPDLPCSTITLSAGAIEVPAVPLSLLGPYGGGITIKGNGSDRVFVSASPDLAIEDLVIDGGQALYAPDSRGGCINSSGPVTLKNSTVSNGTARLGGCIYSASTVSLQNSIVEKCTATGYTGDASHAFQVATGGGVFASSLTLTEGSVLKNNKAAGLVYDGDFYYRGVGGGAALTSTLVCSDSTLHANTAPTGSAAEGGTETFTRCAIDANGGGGSAIHAASTSASHSTISGSYVGIAAGGGTATITSSLLTGNARAVDITDGNVLIVDSTLSGNSQAIYGATGNVSVVASTITNTDFGAFLRNCNMTAQSSIFAKNNSVVDADVYVGPYGPFTFDGANNLIVATNAAVGPGVITVTADPLLLPLADNGGLTLTHALQAGSPAINKGNNVTMLATDQRGDGYVRNFGRADIGAFELQVLGDEVFYAGFD